MSMNARAAAGPAEATSLEEYVRRENLRYQSLGLEGEEAAGTHDRSYLNEAIFAGGVDAQSVLDIGCNLGYFCLEALRRNAASATGIDPDTTTIGQAREIARLSGLAPDYVCGDFEDWDWQGRGFDTVLCLNVLHHLYDPVGAIRKMIRLARRRIVIEFARPTAWDLFKRSGNPLLAAASSSPVIVLGDPSKKHPMSRSFLFTGRALEILFNGHTELFEPLILSPSPFKGRQVAVANRRRIRHLLVVAGPTSSGKSTLIDRLRSDTALRSQFGLGGGDPVFALDQKTPLPTGPLDEVVLHYDVLRPYRRSIKTYARDPRCDFLEAADRITFITLMSPAHVLRRRLGANGAGSLWRGKRMSRRHRDLYDRYDEPAFLEGWYAQWFEFCGRFADRTGNNLLLIGDDSNARTAPAEAWREEYARLG
jgi:SAM-dependent methyltransferase